jgi:hypothetical protein
VSTDSSDRQPENQGPPRILPWLARLPFYAWAAPASLIGLLVALPALLAGASLRRIDGTLEVAGGRLPLWLRRLPGGIDVAAITFGHVILGRDAATLGHCRRHEQVHVRQYERWGLLFFPLYLGSSAWQWLRGRDPYWHNRFEVEAYRLEREPPEAAGR